MKKQIFKIASMHCASCALNIDLDLEDLAGVKSSKTSYAKSVAEIEYDPAQVSENEILTIISKTCSNS